MIPVLRLVGVGQRFGGIQALSDVSLEIARGELTGLIGPNGAGKTTLFNAASGFFAPTSGRVFLHGRDVTAMAPHRLAKLGLVRTFQGARVFPKLTVREGLRIAHHLTLVDRRRAPLIENPIETFGLQRFADESAANLPSGIARIVGIAMATATGASMLLLDEPAAGLNADEAGRLQDVIRDVHAAGATVWVIEHNLQFLMGLVRRVIVLESGRLIADGSPAEVTRDPSVIEAYLGAPSVAAD